MNRNRNPGRKWMDNLFFWILQSALRTMWRSLFFRVLDIGVIKHDGTYTPTSENNRPPLDIIKCIGIYGNVILTLSFITLSSAQLHLKVVLFNVARLQVLKSGCPQCKHDWFLKAVGNAHATLFYNKSYWRLMHFSEFKIWKISSGVDSTNGVSQLTTSQATRSNTLVHRIEALQTWMLPWDRPKVQWAEIRSVNKHDLNLLVKDVMYFWWWFISIGPRVAPAAFMKCFHGVHTGLLENCWYSSSISITV